MTVASLAQAAPPENLAGAIQRSTDRDRRRIPILVLNPGQVFLQNSGNGRINALYPDDDAKPPLTDVLSAFRRELVSCASVQVVAPVTRYTINPDPGPPEEWAAVGRESAARLLFTSLTPAQWAAASSPSGLGLSDLPQKRQKTWFLSLLPKPFVLQENQVSPEGHHSPVTADNGEAHTVTLSPEQVRLRVVRSMEWMYRQGAGTSYIGGAGADNEEAYPRGRRYWTRAYRTEIVEPADSYQERLDEAAFLREPNRLRKGDLLFNTAPLFGKAVTLSGVKTLGELVQRVAQATGVELYADRRLTGLPVMILGNEDSTADAADVMKALCLATTGTIRRVTDPESKESVYLLAGDHAPIMPPRLRLAEWAQEVEALLGTERILFAETARQGGFARGIGLTDEASRLIPPAVMRAAEEKIAAPDRDANDDFVSIPIHTLPPAAQAKVKRDREWHRESLFDGGAKLDKQNVHAWFKVRTELLAPGYGTLPGPELGNLNDLLPRKPRPLMVPKKPAPKPALSAPPITLPPTVMKFAALKVVAKDDAEVKTAAVWAKRHGFAALLVRVSLWEAGVTERIARLVVIGDAHGVKIYPVVSLLRVPPADPAKKDAPPHNLARARNLFGETFREYGIRRGESPALQTPYWAGRFALHREADWLDASDEPVRKATAERLGRLSRATGIAGVVLESIAAPGTTSPVPFWSDGRIAARHTGFTDSLRVAFIRQENLDPLDMPPYTSLDPSINWSSYAEVSPFLGDDPALNDRFRQYPAHRRDASGRWSVPPPGRIDGDTPAARAWSVLAYEQNRSWIGALRREADLPASLPVLVEAPSEPAPYSLSQWTLPWDASEPLLPETMGKERLMHRILRKESTHDTVRSDFGPRLIQQLGTGKEPLYSGLIADLSHIPLRQGLDILSPLTPSAK
ncbi:MAG: hypothetical protein H7145_00155 [Akkermansiaceae bacterium]|nr:hypothetical protein [Armatimonadota bacterium]